MFKMVDVNGKNEIALYTYLKVSCYPKIKHEYLLINIGIKEMLVSLRMTGKMLNLECISGVLMVYSDMNKIQGQKSHSFNISFLSRLYYNIMNYNFG